MTEMLHEHGIQKFDSGFVPLINQRVSMTYNRISKLIEVVCGENSYRYTDPSLPDKAYFVLAVKKSSYGSDTEVFLFTESSRPFKSGEDQLRNQPNFTSELPKKKQPTVERDLAEANKPAVENELTKTKQPTVERDLAEANKPTVKNELPKTKQPTVERDLAEANESAVKNELPKPKPPQLPPGEWL